MRRSDYWAIFRCSPACLTRTFEHHLDIEVARYLNLLGQLGRTSFRTYMIRITACRCRCGIDQSVVCWLRRKRQRAHLSFPCPYSIAIEWPLSLLAMSSWCTDSPVALCTSSSCHSYSRYCKSSQLSALLYLVHFYQSPSKAYLLPPQLIEQSLLTILPSISCKKSWIVSTSLI